MPAPQHDYAQRYYRPGEFQQIAPESKLNVSSSHVNANDFKANIDSNGKISLQVENTRQNSVSLGYVRYNGSFSDCQANGSTINYNNGQNRLLSINQPGTYFAQVTHNADRTSTINVIPDPSLSAVKIQLGNQVYFLNINQLKQEREQAKQREAEEAKLRAQKEAEEQRRLAEEAKKAEEAAKKRAEEEAKRNSAAKESSFSDEGKTESTDPSTTSEAEDISPSDKDYLTKFSGVKMPRAELSEGAENLIPGAAIAAFANGVRRNNQAFLDEKADQLEENKTKNGRINPESSPEIEAARERIGKTANNALDAQDQYKELKENQNKFEKALLKENARLIKAMQKFGLESEEYKTLEERLKSNSKLTAEYKLKQLELAEKMAEASDKKMSTRGNKALVSLRDEVPKAYDRLKALGELSDADYQVKRDAFTAKVAKLIEDGHGSLGAKFAIRTSPIVAGIQEKVPFVKSTATYLEERRNKKVFEGKAAKEVESLSNLSEQELLEKTTTKQLKALDHKLEKQEIKFRTEEISQPGSKTTQLERLQSLRQDLSLSAKKYLESKLSQADLDPKEKVKLQKALYQDWEAKIKEAQVKKALPQSEIDAFNKAHNDYRIDKGLGKKFNEVGQFNSNERFINELNARLKDANLGSEAYLEEAKKLAQAKNDIIKLQRELVDPGTDPKKLAEIRKSLNEVTTLREKQLNHTIKVAEDYLTSASKTSSATPSNKSAAQILAEFDKITGELKVLKAEAGLVRVRSGGIGVKGVNAEQAKQLKEATQQKEAAVKEVKTSAEEVETKVSSKAKELDVLKARQDLIEKQIKVQETHLKAEKLLKERFENNLKQYDVEGPLPEDQQLKAKQLQDSIKHQEELIETVEQNKKVLESRKLINAQEQALIDINEKLRRNPGDDTLKRAKANAEKTIKEEKVRLQEKFTVVESSIREKGNVIKRKLNQEHTSVGKAIGFAALTEAVLAPLSADYADESLHSAVPTSINFIARSLTNKDFEKQWEFETQEYGKTISGLAEFSKAGGDAGVIGGGAYLGLRGISALHGATTANVSAFGIGRGLGFIGRASTGGAAGMALSGLYGYKNFSDGRIGEMSDLQVFGKATSPIALGAVGGAFIGGPIGAGAGALAGGIGDGIGVARGLVVLESRLEANEKMRAVRNDLERGLAGLTFTSSELQKYTAGRRSYAQYTDEEKEVIDNYSSRLALSNLFSSLNENELRELGFKISKPNDSELKLRENERHNWDNLQELTSTAWFYDTQKEKLMGTPLYNRFEQIYNNAGSTVSAVYAASMRSNTEYAKLDSPKWALFGEQLGNQYKGLFGGAASTSRSVSGGVTQTKSDLKGYVGDLMQREDFKALNESSSLEEINDYLTKYFPQFENVSRNDYLFAELLNSFANGSVPVEETVIGRALLDLRDPSRLETRYDAAIDESIALIRPPELD